MNPTIYPLVLLVHIFTAVILVGTSLMAPLVRRFIQSAATARELAQWVDFAARATKLNPLVAIALLATGVYLGTAGWWVTGWFAISVLAWILNGVLAGAVVKPAFRALAAAAGGEDGKVSAELDQLRHEPRLQIAEEVMLASDVVILLVMVLKPSLVVSASVLVAAIVGTVGAGALGRRRRSLGRTLLAEAAGRS
jgi:hypothetical protein